MEWSTVIVGIFTAACALIGTYISNSKTQAIMGYRIEQLEKKVDKHNNVVERTYKLEKDLSTAFIKLDDLRADLNKIENNR